MRNTTILITFAGITFLAWYFSQYNISQSSQEQDSEYLIVGTNAEFAPFSFMQNNEIVGFDIDITQEIAKRIDKKIKLKNMSFAALIPEIQMGSIHMIAAGMTPTEQREQRVFFTKPHFDNDSLIAVQPLHAKKIDSPDALARKTIIVNQGYTADRYVSGIEGARITRLSSPMVSTGILALQSGKADAYVASHSSLQPYIQAHGMQGFHYTPLENSEEFYALAISKKYPALYQQIQSALVDMEKDGTLKSLRNKWKL